MRVVPDDLFSPSPPDTTPTPPEHLSVVEQEIALADAALAAGSDHDSVSRGIDNTVARNLFQESRRMTTSTAPLRPPSPTSSDDMPMLIDVPFDQWLPDRPDRWHDLRGHQASLAHRLATTEQQVVALTRELLWTRRELMQALVDQRQISREHNDLVREHMLAFEERRAQLREHMDMQSDILHAVRTTAVVDYVDDPSAPTVARHITDVLGPFQSDAPPVYSPPASLFDEPSGSAPPLPTVALRAMSTAVAPVPPSLVTRATVRRQPVGRRPDMPRLSQTCLTAYITVNGLQALVLFDSGSTTDSVSPDFARVAGLSVFELENPVILQLGCVGSRSRINFGATVPIAFGKAVQDVYFDVVNLDRYDAVLGTPFMRRFGVRLDFGSSIIRIDDVSIVALAPEEEERGVGRRVKQFPRRAMTAGNSN
ncbi:hypothetical protein B0H21DRAFT_757010 [Amylocystis lapponica]|nr:hypothetical protein B0H21DRAFT_757010 [Amylocystis lapponica]